MNAYRVYLADGTDYVTSMNATLEEAVRYFVNKELNVGQGGEDRMVRVDAVLPAFHAVSITPPDLEPLTQRLKQPCVNSYAQQETTHADHTNPDYCITTTDGNTVKSKNLATLTDQYKRAKHTTP